MATGRRKAAKRGKAGKRGGAMRASRGNGRDTGRRPARAEELAAGPRALLGRDEDARAVRPRKDDASVQDPLGDWPED